MVKKSVEKKMEVKEVMAEKAPKAPRVKKVRTAEQVEADKQKMLKLRALIKKK
jgi:hypothetical protein